MMESIVELGSYVSSPFLLEGALLAVQITVLGMIFGVALGLGLAIARLSRFPVFAGAAGSYIWFMRGTPLLLQLVFIFDALPLAGIKLDSFSTAVIAFSLNEAAFSAEIIRGGLLSVAQTQYAAAASLGMSPWHTLSRIILPQALRAILPSLMNNAIGMLKMTSVASIIFVNELTFRAQQIVGQNFKFFTVFGAAAVVYLALTTVISALQRWLERRLDPERERKVPDAPALPTAAESAKCDEGPECSDGVKRQPLIDAPVFVALSNVHKSYGRREILKGVDLTVRRGEVLVILGPSGSGKSTLLRLINHLEAVDQGEIRIDGDYVGYRSTPSGPKPVRNLARARAQARIGFVFQHFNLFAHLTALGNVIEAPIRVFGQGRQDAVAKGIKALERVGLGNHLHHYPHRLSGGQQQRVAIARALMIEPRLMLFDEPTSALDPELVGEVLRAIADLARLGMTMIIVTHEIRFAREVADRIVFLDEGRVVEQGTPAQVIDAPTHERTRRFLNAANGFGHK